MRFNNRSIAFLAGAACAVAVVALLGTKHHRHHRRAAEGLEHKETLGSWENEGGNLAPALAVAALP